MPADDVLLQELESGELHRFGEWTKLGNSIPGAGAGVYTIWDSEGQLVYVGVAGRNPEGKGLKSRLGSHASGRRSGDQFCVYVADRYVLAILSDEQRTAIAEGSLSFDGLIRDYIHEHLSFRFVVVEDYRQALEVESLVKGGALVADVPLLNPPRTGGSPREL